MTDNTFERRHYEQLASILREFETINQTTLRPPHGRFAPHEIVSVIAQELAKNNSRFNIAKFIAASVTNLQTRSTKALKAPTQNVNVITTKLTGR